MLICLLSGEVLSETQVLVEPAFIEGQSIVRPVQTISADLP